MKLRKIFLNIAATLVLVLAPAPMLLGTASACGNTPAAKQVLSGLNDGQIGKNCGEDRVDNLFGTVVNIMSIIAGVAAVIGIIYAGFKYITSGGESSRVANAKSTLLYALAGLAIAALAQFLVHFVLYQAGKT